MVLHWQVCLVIIGLSVQNEPHVARAMLDAGAAAFLTKESVWNDLHSAIHTATGRVRPPVSAISQSPPPEGLHPS